MAPARRRPLDRRASRAPQVVERADAARGDDGELGGVEHLGQALEIGAREGAVAADLGDDQRRHAVVGELAGDVEQIAARALLPAPHRDLAGPGRRGRPRPGIAAPGGAPASGCSSAAVPSTTRATPTSNRASAASSSRTPPPVCTGTSTAAAMAADRPSG